MKFTILFLQVFIADAQTPTAKPGGAGRSCVQPLVKDRVCRSRLIFYPEFMHIISENVRI